MLPPEVPVQIEVPTHGVVLDGDFSAPARIPGVVIFVHGSGSSRHSPRNRRVAAALRERGLGTLLMDLLTTEEERIDQLTRELRFDIELLTARVLATLGWVTTRLVTVGATVGLFGASTGATTALAVAARRPESVHAVVSRGGRPDLAGADLSGVWAPTLLIVGGLDDVVLDLNRRAQERLVDAELHVVAGATHLFEEPGALDEVTEVAGRFFERELVGAFEGVAAAQ